MLRHFRLLSVTVLTVALLTAGLIWKGYAGIEPPEGTEAIANPKLQGEFTAMFNGVDTAAFTFVGKCGGAEVILGPLFLPFDADSFAALSDPEILDGLFIADDLIGVPAECFSDPSVVIGYTIDKVSKITTQTDTLLVANVVVLGVRELPLL
jgi:hypothetical protein